MMQSANPQAAITVVANAAADMLTLYITPKSQRS